ncbi:hypothetical protein AcV7_006009 [Taiwanofungus camphoratus]|nr:hypothetical protein AcV7_006009 [Antrodia cinnamomea]
MNGTLTSIYVKTSKDFGMFIDVMTSILLSHFFLDLRQVYWLEKGTTYQVTVCDPEIASCMGGNVIPSPRRGFYSPGGDTGLRSCEPLQSGSELILGEHEDREISKWSDES